MTGQESRPWVLLRGPGEPLQRWRFAGIAQSSENRLAKEGEPTAFAVASGRVLAAYERSDRQELRIVCFDFHSGRRAWEAALPERDFFTSFGITDRYVVVRGFSKAWTFALADGKDLAVISGL